MIHMNDLRQTSPILECEDLKSAMSYYTEVLGFECTGVFPEDRVPTWASVKRGGAVIMLSARSPHSEIENPVMTGSIYMYPESVDELWEEFKDKTDVSYEIETFEYGMREFGIRDCNGYLLQFGQDVDEL